MARRALTPLVLGVLGISYLVHPSSASQGATLLSGASRSAVLVSEPATATPSLRVVAAPAAPAGTTVSRTGMPAPGAATATPAAPRPVSYRIASVRVESPSSSPDWSFGRAPLGSLVVGETVSLSIYVIFTSLPERARISVASYLFRGGSLVHRTGVSGRMVRAQTGRLWQHSRYAPRSPGMYVFTALVRVNGRARQASTSFTATSSTQRRPAFVFERLSSLDQQGSPVSSFAPTARVMIVARLTVNPVEQPVSVSVTETLQSLTSKGWFNLGSPLENGFDSPAGSHDFVFSFVPGGGHSSLRIVVEMAIGGEAQQRSVVIRIRQP